METGGVVLKGTTATNLAFRLCVRSTTTGRRFTISGTMKPTKSQYTTVRGLG
jgi:hypothetical protein